MNADKSSHIEMLSRVRLSSKSPKGRTYVVQAYNVSYSVRPVKSTSCVCDCIYAQLVDSIYVLGSEHTNHGFDTKHFAYASSERDQIH
jgi:hypothetical protein